MVIVLLPEKLAQRFRPEKIQQNIHIVKTVFLCYNYSIRRNLFLKLVKVTSGVTPLKACDFTFLATFCNFKHKCWRIGTLHRKTDFTIKLVFMRYLIL